MKKIKRLCLWYALLTKRIFKQRVFLAILLLVVLMAFAVRLMSAHDGRIVTVALARLGDDEFSAAAVERLTSGSSVINYTVFDTENEAVDAVYSGRADAAWIFLADAGAQADRFAASRTSEPAVRIVEREENVVLTLSRGYLYIAMHPYISYGAYRVFLEDISDGTVTEGELRDYYDSKVKKTDLIDFYYVDGTLQRDENPVTAPLRGLLSIIIMLSALASCIYATREERRGVFDHLRRRERAFVPLFCHIVAAVPTALASLAALYFGALWLGWSEFLTMALYVFAVAAFCEIIRILCHGEITLGAVLPVLLLVMLILCPVFLNLDVDMLRPIRHCLPPFYYLNAVTGGGFIQKFAIYDAALCAAAAAIVLIKEHISG